MATDPDTGVTYKRQRTGPLFAGYFNKIGLPGVKALDEDGNTLPNNPWGREQIRFDGDASQLYWPPDMFIVENSILYLRTKNADGTYSRRRIGLIDQNLDEVIRTGDNAQLNGLDVTGPIDFATDSIAIGDPSGSNRHTGLPAIITNLQNDLVGVIRTGDDATLATLSLDPGGSLDLRSNNADGTLNHVVKQQFLSDSGFNPFPSTSYRLLINDTSAGNIDIIYNVQAGAIDYAAGAVVPRHLLGSGSVELDNNGAARLDTDAVDIGDPSGAHRHTSLPAIITNLQDGLVGVIRTGDDAELGNTTVDKLTVQSQVNASEFRFGEVRGLLADGTVGPYTNHGFEKVQDGVPYDGWTYRFLVRDYEQSGRDLVVLYNPSSKVVDYTTTNPTHLLGSGSLEMNSGGAARLDTDAVDIGDPSGAHRHTNLPQIITDLKADTDFSAGKTFTGDVDLQGNVSLGTDPGKIEDLLFYVKNLDTKIGDLQNEVASKPRCVCSGRVDADGTPNANVIQFNLQSQQSTVGDAFGIEKIGIGEYSLTPGGGIRDDYGESRFYSINIMFLEDTQAPYLSQIQETTVSDGSGGVYYPVFNIRIYFFDGAQFNQVDTTFDVRVLVLPNA